MQPDGTLLEEGEHATLTFRRVYRITRQTARGFLPGTHALLDRLEAQLDGRALPEWLQLMRELHPLYPEWSGHAPGPAE